MCETVSREFCDQSKELADLAKPLVGVMRVFLDIMYKNEIKYLCYVTYLQMKTWRI